MSQLVNTDVNSRVTVLKAVLVSHLSSRAFLLLARFWCSGERLHESINEWSKNLYCACAACCQVIGYEPGQVS